MSPCFHGIVSHVSFSKVWNWTVILALIFPLIFCEFLMCVSCSSSNKDPGARAADALSLRDHEGGISLIHLQFMDN